MNYKLMSEIFPVVEQDVQLLEDYRDYKKKRKITVIKKDTSNTKDIFIIQYNPELKERFLYRLNHVYNDLRKQFGDWFSIHLTSSWVNGAAIDEFTELEEPEFWKLKYNKKTWNGMYPNRFKLSDFDINISCSRTEEIYENTVTQRNLQAAENIAEEKGKQVYTPWVRLNALHDIEVDGKKVRIDIYPHKGEDTVNVEHLLKAYNII